MFLRHSTGRFSDLIASGNEVLEARDPERGREVAEALGARYVAIDVTDDASVAQATEHVAAATGGTLDVLINNAGIAGTFADVADVTASDVEAVYAVNVFGAPSTPSSRWPHRHLR